MTDKLDTPLSEDARALLRTFMDRESPTRTQQDEVWAAVSEPTPPPRRLQKAQTGRQQATSPSATTVPSRTWLWVAAAVAAAAIAVVVLGDRSAQQAQRLRDGAPQSAPYQAQPVGAGGQVESSEPVAPPSEPRSVPAPRAPTVEPEPPPAEPVQVQRPTKPRHGVGSDARAEIESLRRAKQALAEGRGQDALKILSAPSPARGRGQLGREREALRIEALCAVGQKVHAQLEARRLLQQKPNHPYADRLRRGCKK